MQWPIFPSFGDFTCPFEFRSVGCRIGSRSRRHCGNDRALSLFSGMWWRLLQKNSHRINEVASDLCSLIINPHIPIPSILCNVWLYLLHIYFYDIGIFLRFILFYLQDKVTEKVKRQRFSHLLSHFSNGHNSWDWPTWMRKEETPPRFPTWMIRTQKLKAYCVVFLGTLSQSWIGEEWMGLGLSLILDVGISSTCWIYWATVPVLICGIFAIFFWVLLYIYIVYLNHLMT